MPSVTLRNATDAWTSADRPSVNYGDARKLWVGSGSRWAYVFFNRAAPLGATITSATLRLYYADTWAAATITVHRLGERWKVSRLTHANRPATTGSSVQASAPAGPAGTYVDVDVKPLLQAVSDGGAWFGFRVATSGGNEPLGASEGTSTLRPTLTVEWTEAPDAPTTLAPSGNAAVSVSKPTLRFDYTDALGDTALAAVQVQVDPAANWTTPAWDSGEVPATVPQLALAATTYPGLANDASTYWRVRVKDGAGLWSEWSDDEQFKRVDLGSVTINNPAASPQNVVHDPTPPFLWAYSATQAAWQVLVTDPATDKTLADSGKQLGTETAWTPPSKKLTGLGPYRVEVRVWDAQHREATPDSLDHAVAVRDFTITSDTTVPPVVGLAVQQPVQDRPVVRLEWTRSSAPDSYLVRRDGDVVAEDLLPGDLLVSGTTYAYEDEGAAPWRTHTWEVQAVVNDAASEWEQVAYTPRSRGIWLLDSERDRLVWLAGSEGGTFTQAEEASVFAPVGSRTVVRRVQGQRGYEGSLAGVLVDRAGLAALESEASLLAMRGEPARPVQLVAGDLSLRVVLGNIGTYPTAQGTPPQRVATFDFWEAP